LKLAEVSAYVDARVAEIMRLEEELATGSQYAQSVVREAFARAFIAGARSGLMHHTEVRLLGACGVRTCRKCACTDLDCSRCIEKLGKPCSWIAPDLCSACEDAP
jgi:hypothetical protein